MVEAGLLNGGDEIPVPYDKFRDRVMFPITDVRNRVIAFGGRALEKDVPAKYMNSPETPLFHKGDNLYNLATARQATHNGAPLIVVEGYVDVIAMVTTGFAASVAPLGTALTENQLMLLWKMADEPILCFDGDKAGQESGVARRGSGAAASQTRKEFALCAAARRPGPRRSRALRRPRRDRGSDLAPRAGLPISSGRARSRAAPLRRRSGARRWKRGSANSRTASATR